MRRPPKFRPLRARRRQLAARLLVAPVAVVALAVPTLASTAGALSHHDERPVFRPPVDAPVIDPFRPPENPYGPGNRGVEYDTEPGDVVRAAASGTVVFAGAVAGALHVTVDHGGGVVSSYSYLQRISVRDGTYVEVGAVIGIAGERLHFGVRVDGSYTDPDSFIGVAARQGAAGAAAGVASARDSRSCSLRSRAARATFPALVRCAHGPLGPRFPLLFAALTGRSGHVSRSCSLHSRAARATFPGRGRAGGVSLRLSLHSRVGPSGSDGVEGCRRINSQPAPSPGRLGVRRGPRRTGRARPEWLSSP